eukprot:TRINITY_DN2593_c0_g1_i5.p1 TRINITY_DN2593_c0_g1~~TRINITY_DN2593_c0_g1_i5.p1  ORF type:complete len:729 (-),score=101.89 TRINITY_DN2593_c0_g1_i5:541-2727(-)
MSQTRKGPVRKLNIRFKPRVKTQLPKDWQLETWKKLQSAIISVHNKTSSEYGQEELYKFTENLCLHKWASELYSKIREECEAHIKAKLTNLKAKQTLDAERFLSFVNNVWRDHCDDMLYIRNIFLHLDRTYALQTTSVLSLWEMGLDLFRTHIATDESIDRKTLYGVLSLVDKERNGETIDTILLKNVISMYISLRIYATKFEPKFLATSARYYSEEGREYVDKLEAADYMIRVEDRIAQELERGEVYLARSTIPPLVLGLEHQLIKNHVEALLERGFKRLVDADRVQDVARMYTLLAKVDRLEDMCKSFYEYIKTTGCSIVTDKERDNEMVVRLLAFRKKLEGLLENACKLNESFASAMKRAYEYFLNVRENRPAELIAKFLNAKLRTTRITDEELETLMDDVMMLFKYINGKDVFTAFYRRDLAKRLLLGKSNSIDAEKSMISKLKMECGSTFTSKLEGMFKDMELSKEIMAAFRQSETHQERLKTKIEMSVNVLRIGYWPAYTPVEARLPQQLAEYQEVFRDFYVNKFNGRKLFWQHSLGHTVLKARFPKGIKEIVVSLLQTIVLVLFNDADPLSYKEIAAATGIEEEILKRTLQSLACARIRMLRKRPPGKEIGEKDVFYWNKVFGHKLYRIKINSIQMKATPKEVKKTKESIFQDRQYQIDAAVVRIMKTRKTLTHPQLMAELYKQLKFPLKPMAVKKRIESLLDREYLERDANNANVYNYLA